jgi:regulatory protein
METSAVFDRYYNLSLRYLSYRPRSEKEVLDYLYEKQKKAPKLTDEIITQILEKLKEYKFIDDAEFVKFWVKSRTEYKNKPIRVIEYELKQKGISQSLISENLSENKNKTDLESAKKLALKKMDFYRSLDPDKRREKVMNYLLRKGFNYDTVKKAVAD